MYTLRPNLILAFHGCDLEERDNLIQSKSAPKPSINEYDWLGHGMYFWENNDQRALEWAEWIRDNPKYSQRKIKTPAVLGAVLSLGNCLDLLDSQSIALVKDAYHKFALSYQEQTKQPLPKNAVGPDRVLRYLNCAVINWLHKLVKNAGETPFDSVRAMFPEGTSLYQDAGFRDKSHIQICIRNADCIKGFFIPRTAKGMLLGDSIEEVL